MPNRAVGRIMGAAALIGATLSLSGCDTLGNPLDLVTGKRTAPDEFLVIARKPLRMPGSLALPEPRLGAGSPLDPDPQGAAVVALLGAPVAGPPTTGASAGEQALLSAANATGTSLPQQAEELSDQAERLEAQQPFEPPLLIDLLSGRTGPQADDDAIVPGAESRRLQRQGLAPSPIDPEERPVEVPDIAQPGTEENFDRRPNNRLPSTPNVTAF